MLVPGPVDALPWLPGSCSSPHPQGAACGQLSTAASLCRLASPPDCPSLGRLPTLLVTSRVWEHA